MIPTRIRPARTVPVTSLDSVPKSDVSVINMEMQASTTRHPPRRLAAWLNRRGGTHAVIVVAVVATIAAWGPPGWMGSKDGDIRSVMTRSVVLSSIAPATAAVRLRRPQLLATKSGHDDAAYWPKVNSLNVTSYATRYNMIFGDVPQDQISRIRSINPNIILMEYSLPGATKSLTQYPGSYYVKDASSGLRVNRNGWWLLDFRNAAVRSARLNTTLAAAPAGGNGYWLDVADANWLNTPFGNVWRDENGKIADLGDLDGGWNPSLSRADKPRYADGTWPLRMLDFIRELRAAAPTKFVVFNTLVGGTVLRANSAWSTYEAQWRSITHGAAKEGYFVTSHGYPLSEGEWKLWLGKAKGIIDQGRYAHIIPLVGHNAQMRIYAFASYLLIADGRYAWFSVQFPADYDTSLYDVDYGAPLGAYQIISTPGGPIYKRQFTNATIWVNPGSVTRTGDGKTLGPNGAILAGPQSTIYGR